MSEIAKSAHSFALAESKPAISEHAQEHAPPFRAAVLGINKKIKMAVLHKITWKEFEKINQILKDYKPIAMEMNDKEDSLWFDRMLALLSKAKKKPYNIEVENLEREDFNRITVIVDMWNAAKYASGIKSIVPYDGECDQISSKLQRAYFKMFNERVFSDG